MSLIVPPGWPFCNISAQVSLFASPKLVLYFPLNAAGSRHPTHRFLLFRGLCIFHLLTKKSVRIAKLAFYFLHLSLGAALSLAALVALESRAALSVWFCALLHPDLRCQLALISIVECQRPAVISLTQFHGWCKGPLPSHGTSILFQAKFISTAIWKG